MRPVDETAYLRVFSSSFLTEMVSAVEFCFIFVSQVLSGWTVVRCLVVGVIISIALLILYIL